MSLAERYNVSKWEMFMTHLESLFSDSKYVKMECFGNKIMNMSTPWIAM